MMQCTSSQMLLVQMQIPRSHPQRFDSYEDGTQEEMSHEQYSVNICESIPTQESTPIGESALQLIHGLHFEKHIWRKDYSFAISRTWV